MSNAERYYNIGLNEMKQYRSGLGKETGGSVQRQPITAIPPTNLGVKGCAWGMGQLEGLEEGHELPSNVRDGAPTGNAVCLTLKATELLFCT